MANDENRSEYDSEYSPKVSGLEDNDNFFELVRRRAGLPNTDQAIKLCQEVTLFLTQFLTADSANRFLHALPQNVEEPIFPQISPLHQSTQTKHPLAKLEHQLEKNWQCDLEEAARLASAVCLTVAERLPIELLEQLSHELPRELQVLLPEKKLVA